MGQVSSTMGPLAKRKRVAFSTTVAPGVPVVRADAEVLRRIVVNLVNNALRFTPAGGAVRLEFSYEQGVLSISVSDTGCGISADQLPYVFDRFVSAPGSRRPARAARVWELSIVRKFADMMGGEVSVESEVGRGSVFTVRLPLDEFEIDEADEGETCDESDMRGGVRRGPACACGRRRRERGECCDAHAGARWDFVRARGKRVRCARRHFARHRPDVVILDVMMPVLDGFQVCERIRQQDEAVPVLFLTAKGDMVDKRIGYSVGADDYLVKPFSGDELRLRVGALLRRARRVSFACAPNGVDTPRNEELAIGELSVNVHTGVTCVAGERKWSSRRMRHASWPCSRTIG